MTYFSLCCMSLNKEGKKHKANLGKTKYSNISSRELIFFVAFCLTYWESEDKMKSNLKLEMHLSAASSEGCPCSALSWDSTSSCVLLSCQLGLDHDDTVTE